MRSLLCAVLGVGEAILIVACAAIVLGVVVTAIVRKAKGKTGCGGDCGCCSACSHCKSESKRNDVNKDY